VQRLNLRLSKGQILLIVVGLAAMCAYPPIVAHLPANTVDPIYYFVAAFALLALGACLWRAWHCPRSIRPHWLLLSAGMLSFVVANIVLVATYRQLPASSVSASLEDFFYFFYGIPLLLAISMPEHGEASPTFFLLDILQAAAAGYLAYLTLFGTLPFTSIPSRPISEAGLALVFDAENLILATLATVRLVVGARGSVERRFFKILAGYLWLYALCVTVFNRLIAIGSFSAHHPTLTQTLPTLVNIPFLLVALAALTLAAPARLQMAPAEQTPFALLANNARPIFISLALVALSAAVARQHLRIALGFIFGAFVIYGVRASMLQSRFQQTRIALEKANTRLEELAMQDGLTGIANRRRFDQRFEMEWHRAHRSERPLSLLLIDVDHFKQLNDSQGHVAGDECLQTLAAALRNVVRRPGDLLARYGGDEFVALLPETDAAGAVRVATLMRETLASQGWSCNADGSPATVSIGCSCWDSRHAATAEELMEAADKALYQAKQQGRNRVEFIEMQPASVQ
jgi:diguanylate cyclase (GGDEF)-like protein